ncbi:hypothetical protein QTO34_019505 [Cnephaeus nilssonii]|uniref:Uncharacterized protein n=1 Tax=Cnephaeus nilssonii TaxID=3371016 RepID=A0AA40HWQ6_CNENI|nr:hypothetical protein QTO34_019505 [Eptesicus nilssonii]
MDRQTRKRRESLGGSFDPLIYTDTIGILGGVPKGYKARNQTATGFESVLFWWPTLKKNQRVVNYTPDTVKEIAEQLDATSRMTWESRLALDLILAEKGGICIMLGVSAVHSFWTTQPDGPSLRP